MLTVLSAAILIGAEVFGAAFAGGWAIANLFSLGDYGVHVMQALFFIVGIAVMVSLRALGAASRAVHQRQVTVPRARPN